VDDWTATISTKLTTMPGNGLLGRAALSLFTSSLVPASYTNYNSSLRHFSAFWHEDNTHSMLATPPTVVCDRAWLGLQGTVATGSLQPQYSGETTFSRTINNPQSQWVGSSRTPNGV
jgi:hypothetical protein